MTTLLKNKRSCSVLSLPLTNYIQNTFLGEVSKCRRFVSRFEEQYFGPKTRDKRKSDGFSNRRSDGFQNRKSAFREDRESDDANTPDILYGRNVCNIAIKYSRRPIFRVLMNRNWQKSLPDDDRVKSIVDIIEERGIEIEYHSPSKLSQLSEGRPHQGICMKTGKLSPLLLNKTLLNQLIEDNKQQLWVMLYDIYDPMNVGAILRSCSFLGINTAFMTSNCSPLSATTCKASSGASELMKLYHVSSSIQFVQHLQDNGWDIIGTDMEPSEDISENIKSKYEYITSVKLRKPSLLILGSEGSGIPDELKEKCDKMVAIKSAQGDGPSISCLNVSAATAIILHQLLSTIEIS